MFLNSWAIALTLVSFLSCFLMLMAGRTAFRVLRLWDLSSDSNTQIELEGETWLSSTLVMYGACFQIISLVLLVFAADQFSGFIHGAMCATGSLLANDYGMPLLYLKLGSSFLAGLWIVVHRLDITGEEYPLVTFKYVLLLVLVPLVLLDFVLQLNYISNLTPDIITSCCAVVFDNAPKNATFSGLIQRPLRLFYMLGGGLLIWGVACRLVKRRQTMVALYTLLMVAFVFLAVDTIISTISSYIYAMPYHKCPFCIIKAEYHFIGFILYFLLFGAGFFGVSSGFIQLFQNKKSLLTSIRLAQNRYLTCSSVMLLLFLILSSYHMLVYRFLGGE